MIQNGVLLMEKSLAHNSVCRRDMLCGTDGSPTSHQTVPRLLPAWHGPDRYEQDMARQRDLERSGWQFVRIRGSDFYRDSANAMEPLWAELDRLGIMPGGIDEAAAEPPSPTASPPIEHKEAEETIRGELLPADI